MIQTNTIKAAGVPEKDIRQLEAAWDAFQSAKNHTPHQTPHIACTGIYNAGKSTLLNALAGKEIFPTGDVPTTKKVAQAEFDGAVYIDTPGLNAAEEDDQETQSAYETADFILFVSSAQNGGISEAEAAWLQKLKARYSSLQQRLIFVLTHCTQVEEEQLPAIREQVSGDLEKAMGFAPEQIFCVDSVTYQDGVAEKESLLVENSGIQTLRGHITEKITEADKLLTEAWKSELAQRRKDVQQQISTIHAMVKETQDKAGSEQKKKLTAVDKAWAEFERALKEAMPSTSKISPISVPYTSLDYDYATGKDRSFTAAWRKSHEMAKPYYEKANREIQEFADKTSRRVKDQYCSVGMDSIYVHHCSGVNNAFDKGVLALQRCGVPLSRPKEISVSPYSIEKAYGELYECLSFGCNFDWRDAKDDGTVDSSTDYVSGMFGRMKEVTVWTYSASKAVRHLEKLLGDQLKFNANSANNALNWYWHNFCEKLLPEIEKRKATLKMQVDNYKATLSQSATSSGTQSALSYLESLKSEVSQ